MGAAEDVPEEEGDHSYREAQCVPGCDPKDVNKGSKYLFLKMEANDRMRRNKPKTRYAFLDVEQQERPLGVP